MAVTQGTLNAVEDLRRKLLTMTNDQTLALTRAWVQAWDVLLPEFEAALTDLLSSAKNGAVPYSVVARNVRLKAALQASQEYLRVLAPQTAEIISSDVYRAVLDAVDGHAAVVATQLPPPGPGVATAGINFTRVPVQALTAIVERTTEQIHASSWELSADAQQALKQGLVRGIALGDNPRTTAARILKDAESGFNGGLNRALTLARTETLDAHRAATKASEMANLEVLAEWEWHCELGPRTCPSCLAQHGSRHPLDESGPNDHQNGRCSRVSITKTWKELGFDIPEPASVTPSAKDWYDGLTEDSQVAIMGPTRQRLLADGSIQWDDLSTVRKAAGWRDSMGTTSIRDLLAKAADD